MRNLWLVARREYRSTVGRRGFLLGALAIPLGMALLIAVAIMVQTGGQDGRPIGYVDRAGILTPEAARTSPAREALPPADPALTVIPYPDEAAALEALNREEIQAFFVFPAGYPSSLRTELYYLQRPPGNEAWGQFDDFVRLNLVAGLPAAAQQRLIRGPQVVVQDVASGREFSQSGIINVLVPLAASMFFMVATMSASGYMLRVVADEKENRTMEVLLTSVTPGQLIGGKAAGLLAAALSQLGIYALAAAIGLRVAAPYVAMLREASVPWGYLGLMALFFFPAYALISAVMVAIGAAVTEVQQGQQIAGLLNLLFMLPVFFLALLFENPGHPLLVALTLFPPTSFLMISLRWGLGSLPLWQVVAGWVLLVAGAIGMVRAAARIFRAGMLRYGQPLTLRAALAALREGRGL
ncbi:MAG: ABC transporter permease [Chloroflexi bacterium]|nr:ABC transporter permease [Chloroflexota bacterium]